MRTHQKIGPMIRQLRVSKSMTILELSNATGLSTGLISQIERNKVTPSITAMLQIARALNETMGYFFDEQEEKKSFVCRASERRRIITGDNSRIYELLAPTTNRKIEFVHITLKDCKNRALEKTSHIGEECGYVLKGSMVVIIDDESFVLHEGDSIYFDSSLPHVYENYDDEECISIWAMTPPSW